MAGRTVILCWYFGVFLHHCTDPVKLVVGEWWNVERKKKKRKSIDKTVDVLRCIINSLLILVKFGMKRKHVRGIKNTNDTPS